MNDLPLFNIFVPSQVPSKKIMIILHGRGDSSKGFTWLPQILGFDDMNYLLLDAPYEYFGGCSWYDLPPNQMIGIAHSSSLLADILDELFEEEYDASQSFLFGFSQGALLTFEFGARYEKQLAGYIGVSGYIYDADNLLNEMNPALKNANWLATHGTSDEVLPYEVSKSQIETLQASGLNIDFQTYDKAHTMIEEEVAYIKNWIQDKMNKQDVLS